METSGSAARVDLSVVIPCLNEAATLAQCIKAAWAGIAHAGIAGEVIVADNGSSDGSIEIADQAGAVVVHVQEKGYGSALRGGINAARGRWVIMGDGDGSYDFTKIDDFVEKLRAGYDLVMGCRMPRGGGTILPGAMPWKNRHIGNPVLSFIGKVLFNVPINDFHSGLRGFSKWAYERMQLKTTGMEFASEMVLKSALAGLKIAEVPITLHPDGRNRPPHLRPWQDGWRHLRLMLVFSPRWVFFIPGMLLCLAGLTVASATSLGPRHIGPTTFDVGTLTMACMSLIIGFQCLSLAYFAKVFAIGEGILPNDPKMAWAFRHINLEKGLLLGIAIMLGGFALFTQAFRNWQLTGFGHLDYAENLRWLTLAATFMVVGFQAITTSFFLSVLGLKTSTRKPPENNPAKAATLPVASPHPQPTPIYESTR